MEGSGSATMNLPVVLSSLNACPQNLQIQSKTTRGETAREKSHGGETTNGEMVKGPNNLDIPERGPG